MFKLSKSKKVLDYNSTYNKDTLLITKRKAGKIRYYDINSVSDTKSVTFPSVTSIVSLLTEPGITKWRKSIGEEKASEISLIASERGTRMHEYCERFLKGESFDIILENDRSMFQKAFLTPLINSVDNIYCIETQLFSTKYEYAGTVDLICEYDGIMSIVDFKTSSKPKKEEYCEHYFIQTAAYSLAFREMTGIEINHLVLIIGVDGMDEAQIFTCSFPEMYEEKFLQTLDDFRKTYFSI